MSDLGPSWPSCNSAPLTINLHPPPPPKMKIVEFKNRLDPVSENRNENSIFLHCLPSTRPINSDCDIAWKNIFQNFVDANFVKLLKYFHYTVT